MMTPEEFAKKMCDLEREFHHDPEDKHARMDGLMCEVLRQLGYGAGIDTFQNAEMWYA